MARKRIGDLLTESNIISETQLQEALSQKGTNEKVGELLIRLGYVTEQQLIEVLEFQLGIPHVNLYRFDIDPSVAKLIPESLARRYQALAIRKNKNRLYVAMSDPLDFYAIDDIKMSTGFTVETVIASASELTNLIDQTYGLSEPMDELESLLPQDEGLETQVTDEDSPVARLMTQLIEHGLKTQASDIHIEPRAGEVLIRYRIDGFLRTEQRLPKHMQNMLTARVKILANLDIAERRLPQDGRFQMDINVRHVDLRVSTMPTVHGEKCVLRLFDMTNAILAIPDLKLSPHNQKLFEEMIRSPYGIILLTGPTGSGKTTTLYAGLSELMSDEHNIVTIEDPVEFELDGVNQVQVNPAIGLTFARGLRSLLRQDPDIVMVGEIRDAETAEIAIRTALTGHLVFSTLHTTDAVGSLNRLIDMGIEPFLVASAIVGVVAQRLVRRICDKCGNPYEPTEAEWNWLHRYGVSEGNFKRGKGCGYCNHTGYAGRMAVQEIVQLDDELQHLVLEKRSSADYLRSAIKQGMKTMLEDGIRKAALGQTTISEVMRVTLGD
ncbi:GspE/PulE family protein [Alicyclobacillus sp. SO9]|uniref:GspE/PulE family protein n=1 Tax=Alicyclobacillus sp. SO9 TaxID=2665646 RepID=UPI0018E746F9|nr:GspE/PulE family protein [Alicyclobacillus sp. SO9]QQE77543.1 type II/IV secretion system protein [Alicyclobacillus sp. SO9]